MEVIGIPASREDASLKTITPDYGNADPGIPETGADSEDMYAKPDSEASTHNVTASDSQDRCRSPSLGATQETLVHSPLHTLPARSEAWQLHKKKMGRFDTAVKRAIAVSKSQTVGQEQIETPVRVTPAINLSFDDAVRHMIPWEACCTWRVRMSHPHV